MPATTWAKSRPGESEKYLENNRFLIDVAQHLRHYGLVIAHHKPGESKMEPRHLRSLRRAAEAASDEAHRLEGLSLSHFDQAAIKAAIHRAIKAETRAWSAYRKAFNAAVAANAQAAL